MTLCQLPEEVLYLKGNVCVGMFICEFAAMLVLLLGICRANSIILFLRILLVYLTGNLILGGVLGMMKEHTFGRQLLSYCSQHAVWFYGIFMVLAGVTGLLHSVLQKQQRISVYETAVCVWLHGKCFVLRGYMDSGNMLVDSLTGKPVLVACYGAFEKYLSEEHQYIINDFFAKGGVDNETLRAYHASRLRWMVCSSVGMNGRVLPLLTVDKVRYVINKRVVECVSQPVLLFDGALMEGAYDILLNKDL